MLRARGGNLPSSQNGNEQEEGSGLNCNQRGINQKPKLTSTNARGKTEKREQEGGEERVGEGRQRERRQGREEKREGGRKQA